MIIMSLPRRQSKDRQLPYSYVWFKIKLNNRLRRADFVYLCGGEPASGDFSSI